MNGPDLDRLDGDHTPSCPLWTAPQVDDSTCTCPTRLSDAPVMATALRWLLNDEAGLDFVADPNGHGMPEGAQ